MTPEQKLLINIGLSILKNIEVYESLTGISGRGFDKCIKDIRKDLENFTITPIAIHQ